MIGLLFYLVVVSGDEISSQASILNNIDNHGHQLILKGIIIENKTDAEDPDLHRET